MTPVYRIELDDALVRVRNNNLNLNKPLAEKLAVVSALCLFASLPLLMILGWGGYVWPLMVIGLLSGVGSFFLFKSIPPGAESRYALVIFTAPSSIRQVESKGRELQYRLFLDGRQFPVSRSIWQAMPQTGEAAVFLTEDDEKVFHITRASWVDRSRLELLSPSGKVSVEVSVQKKSRGKKPAKVKATAAGSAVKRKPVKSNSTKTAKKSSQRKSVRGKKS